MSKSGCVSRQPPRSRPTTLSPESASSLARMVPVSPTPTVTTSTGFSLVAMALALRLVVEHHVYRVAVLIDLCDSLVDVGDGDRLRAVGDVVLVDEAGVYSGDAGEADQLPARLVAVAAVHGVGKEAFDGVVQEQIEEELRAAIAVGVADRGAVHLGGRERRLVALLRRALGPGSLLVFPRHRAVAAEELLVDEVGDAGFLGAGPQLVLGDKARDRGIDERGLRLREEHVRARLGRGGRGAFCLRGMLRMACVRIGRQA